jgi:alpha-1,3-fucosyltransferase
VWNAFERAEVRIFGKGKDVIANQNCTYTWCKIVDKREERPLEHYDAIVVVLNDQFTSADQLMIPEFPNKRNELQRLVFFTQEFPPALIPYYDMTRLANFFPLDNHVQNRRRYSFTLRPSHSERKTLPGRQKRLNN